jgi:hypothetical protein
MLIVSRFHDYYDTIKSFGIDKTVVYNRKKEETFFKGPHMYSDGLFQKPFRATRIIGFCGKLYPLLETKGFLIYDRKIALDVVKDSWNKKDINKCFSEDIKDPGLLKIFVEKKVPVFIYGDYLAGKYENGKSRQLILNPKLSDWGFQSVKDPVTAFQDIYMYISGVLGVSAPETVEISDKEMAKKKGHDGEWSFRKPPGKRGKNRWR